MADVPVLVCTAGHLAGQRIRIPEGGLGIGRSEENTVVVVDEGVSRYHARLLFDNGSLWIQDVGSRNGIFINGGRLTAHKALKVGDAITIAQHTFELQWEDERGSAAESSSRGVAPEPARARESEADRESKRRWYWPFS